MSENEQDDGGGPYMLAECRQYDDPRKVTQALVKLAADFPVVCPGGTPEVSAIPQGYRVSLTAYLPTEADVYKDKGSGQTCFKATFLKKLAAGLGIEWLPSETRRLDGFAHPFVCSMVVAGRYRDWSGEWRTITGSHMLDLRDEAEHGMTDKQLPQARRNIQQLCETKAKSRAIADACVSRTIDPRDLNRPIPCAKLYRADSDIDPAQASAAMYGQPRGDAPRSVEAEIMDDATGEVRSSGRFRADTPSGKPAADPRAAAPSSAGATREPSSGPTTASPTDPAPAAPAAKKDTSRTINNPGHSGHGKLFAVATEDELRAYDARLIETLSRKDLTGPHREAAEAKQRRLYEEIESRDAGELNL